MFRRGPDRELEAVDRQDVVRPDRTDGAVVPVHALPHLDPGADRRDREELDEQAGLDGEACVAEAEEVAAVVAIVAPRHEARGRADAEHGVVVEREAEPVVRRGEAAGLAGPRRTSIAG